jgi:hypothetical protein
VQDIARQCNILKDDGIAMEGPAFRQMTDAQILKVLPRLTVIARCSPEDKLKMVKLLRAQGEVVAGTTRTCLMFVFVFFLFWFFFRLMLLYSFHFSHCSYW